MGFWEAHDIENGRSSDVKLRLSVVPVRARGPPLSDGSSMNLRIDPPVGTIARPLASKVVVPESVLIECV